MKTYVPFSSENPKTRLSSLLSDEERVEFVYACLKDVLEALEKTDAAEPVVLSTEPVDTEHENVVRDEPLTPAVNAVLRDASPPVAVVVADLPLVTPAAVERLFAPAAEFVVAPGRGGGTNAFVTRVSGFRVDYHGTSFLDHVEKARELGADVGVVDSFRLSTDADEPDDIVEVLLHGEGHAADFARERFELVEDEEERVKAERKHD
ncbi:MAG: 2-phospho-L-lactate guanylyltransferase [Halobacteriales archaeon]|nr:2-phospho-L-lactate guanylyltransferase [Halobacteriales archaeon]